MLMKMAGLIGTQSGNSTFIEFMNWKDQVPIFTPNQITVLNSKAFEMIYVLVFLIFRNTDTVDLRLKINDLPGTVTKLDFYCIIMQMFGLGYTNRLHRYIFLVILSKVGF